MSDEEIVRRGTQIYEERLRPSLEPHRNGEFIAIAVEDGDYEVASTSLEAGISLRKRHPDAVFYIARIGYPYSVSFPTPFPHAAVGKS
jgi:hypothetical protein